VTSCMGHLITMDNCNANEGQKRSLAFFQSRWGTKSSSLAWRPDYLMTIAMTGGVAKASRGCSTFFFDNDNTMSGLHWLRFFFFLLLQGLKNRLRGFKILNVWSL
jgi:hypothetical protein